MAMPPIEVLRGGVEDQVGAQLQGPLVVGRGEGVVHGQHGGAAHQGHHLSHTGDVREAEHGVGRRLQHHQLGVGPQGGLEGRQVAGIHLGIGEAEAGHHLVQQAEGAAVDVVAQHHVVAAGELLEDGLYRRHAGAEGHAVGAAFERSQVGLHRIAGGVAHAGVVEALVEAQPFLDVSAGEIDGRHDGPVGGIRRLAGVDAERVEAAFVVHGAILP